MQDPVQGAVLVADALDEPTGRTRFTQVSGPVHGVDPLQPQGFQSGARLG
ncbi:hypothetical protein GCM10027199_37440 [Amycolatopsis magusensis]